MILLINPYTSKKVIILGIFSSKLRKESHFATNTAHFFTLLVEVAQNQKREIEERKMKVQIIQKDSSSNNLQFPGRSRLESVCSICQSTLCNRAVGFGRESRYGFENFGEMALALVANHSGNFNYRDLRFSKEFAGFFNP